MSHITVLIDYCNISQVRVNTSQLCHHLWRLCQLIQFIFFLLFIFIKKSVIININVFVSCALGNIFSKVPLFSLSFVHLKTCSWVSSKYVLFPSQLLQFRFSYIYIFLISFNFRNCCPHFKQFFFKWNCCKSWNNYLFNVGIIFFQNSALKCFTFDDSLRGFER